MAYTREGIDAHVREYFSRQLQSTFIQRNPLLYFLGMRSAEGRTQLGQPRASALFGGENLGESQMEMMLGSKEIYHTYQKSEPNDGSNVDYGGATPTASSFAEDNAGQTAFRWTDWYEPLKIREHSLTFAQGGSEIGAIVERAAAPVWIRFQKRINDLLWNGGTQNGDSSVNMDSTSEQNREVWKEPLGLRYVVGTSDNVYGRVDRSVETLLNPRSIDASAEFGSAVIDLNIDRNIRYGYTRADTGAQVDGLANKSPNGVGPTLNITTPELWNELATQAEGRATIYHEGDDLPYAPVSGFKYPVINHNGCYYTWDKDCPANTLYSLSLDQWLMEIAAGKNFEWSGFTNKAMTEEGGEKYEWGQYMVMFRLSCERPDLNAVVTNLQTG